MSVDETGRSWDASILDGMGVDARDVAWRKAFLLFDEADAARLQALQAQARSFADALVEEFYEHMLAFEETRAFLRDPRVLERVKRTQREYFLQLMGGDYGPDYVRSRMKVGVIHQRINLPLKAYFGAYNFYLRALGRRLLSGPEGPTPENAETFLSLLRLVFFDISLAIESHVFLREETIRAQQQAIREMSTPVLRVRDRLLIVPLVGMIDTYRARQLTEELLRSIRANRAKVVVIDITGVGVVDSAVANHLIQTIQASRLMGAQVVVTGVSAEVAQTLVRIGVDLSELDTVGDLQEGIEEAERLLGYRVVRVPRSEPAESADDVED